MGVGVGGVGMMDDSADILIRPVSPEGNHCEQFWVGHECLFFDVVRLSFPLPITASPTRTFKGALNDGFIEAVVSHDMPEPCQFPSLDSCQKIFLWTHNDVELAPHPVVGLVLQAGEAKKFPQTLGPKATCRLGGKNKVLSKFCVIGTRLLLIFSHVS